MPLIRQSWISLLVVFFTGEVLNQCLFYYREFLQHSFGPEGIYYQLNLAMIKMTVGFFYFIIISLKSWQLLENTAPRPLFIFIKDTFTPLFVESLRVWTRILIGTVCFIIPGIYLGVRYGFVTLVVLFDPAYGAGKIDALKKSKTLVNSWSIGISLAILYILDFSAAQFFSEMRFETATNSFESLIWGPAELITLVLSNLLIFNYFYLILKNQAAPNVDLATSTSSDIT